jgi:hypothetical protein
MHEGATPPAALDQVDQLIGAALSVVPVEHAGTEVDDAEVRLGTRRVVAVHRPDLVAVVHAAQEQLHHRRQRVAITVEGVVDGAVYL